MISWIPLESVDQLQQLIDDSAISPCIIFKHSTACSGSAMALFRLEEDWSFSPDELRAYKLDVLQQRELSAQIADAFAAHHESPQLLFIQDGECELELSHLEINVAEIKEMLCE